MNIESPAAIVRAVSLSRQISTGDTNVHILHDVSLDIFPGEACAILGASGSGKTTLLALLAGLDLPNSGEVYLDGELVSELEEDARARLRLGRVGFVFQSFQLLPALTALENVMLPLELAGESRARDAAAALLEQVGLAARLHHTPRQLSGGEQQRVALARAFVTQPRILFADEPTGNLDAATGEEIISLLLRLNQERGTTLVLVTHDETLARRCSRHLKLASGRIVVDQHLVADLSPRAR
jgi:putative ABC transport system ATP-binding protein